MRTMPRAALVEDDLIARLAAIGPSTPSELFGERDRRLARSARERDDARLRPSPSGGAMAADREGDRPRRPPARVERDGEVAAGELVAVPRMAPKAICGVRAGAVQHAGRIAAAGPQSASQHRHELRRTDAVARRGNAIPLLVERARVRPARASPDRASARVPGRPGRCETDRQTIDAGAAPPRDRPLQPRGARPAGCCSARVRSRSTRRRRRARRGERPPSRRAAALRTSGRSARRRAPTLAARRAHDGVHDRPGAFAEVNEVYAILLRRRIRRRAWRSAWRQLPQRRAGRDRRDRRAG